MRQWLYELSCGVEYGHDWDTEEPEGATKYIVASQAHSAMLLAIQGCGETYLFPADEDGKINNWGELPGSRKGGGLDPDELMADFLSQCTAAKGGAA